MPPENDPAPQNTPTATPPTATATPPAPLPTENPAPPSTDPPARHVPVEELAAERERRHQAEREAATEKAKREALEREKLSKEQQLELDAKQGREALAKAEKLTRKANLLTTLAGKGLVGPQALAASKLIDGVTYDDVTHMPTNLDARIEAAKATYGAAFPGVTPAPPAPVNPNNPTSPLAQHVVYPNLHQGPRETPAPDEDAQFNAFFGANFPAAAQQQAS